MFVDSNTETMLASPTGSVSSSTSDGEDNKGRSFSCNMCTYRTDRKNNLKRHILTMHEISSALLECCGHRFLNKAELRMHTQKCHRDGYHCGVCGRVFCRKALLKRHYSVHSGYKEFSCQQCSYETSHKSNLERHMRVHQKNGGPLARHLLEGFLPELPQQNTHFPLTLPLHNTVLPAQHFPLYGDQVNPPFYHTPRLPPSPWPVLPPSHTPLLNHHAPYLPHYPPQHVFTPNTDLCSLMPSKPSPRKTGPSKSFTVSALLGEALHREDEASPLPPWAQHSSQPHLYGESPSSGQVTTDGILRNGSSPHTPTAPATLTPTAPATLTPAAPATLTPTAPATRTPTPAFSSISPLNLTKVTSARDVQASIQTYTSPLWDAPVVSFTHHNYFDPYHTVYSFPPVHRTHWRPNGASLQYATASSILTPLPHHRDQPYSSGSSGYGSLGEESPRPMIEDQPQVKDHKDVFSQSHTDDHKDDFSQSHTDDHKDDFSQSHTDAHKDDFSQSHTDDHRSDFSQSHTDDHKDDFSQSHTDAHKSDFSQSHTDDHKSDFSQSHTDDHKSDFSQSHTDDHKSDFSQSHTDDHKSDFSQSHTDDHKSDFSQSHTNDHQDYIPKKLRASKKFQMQKCPE